MPRRSAENGQRRRRAYALAGIGLLAAAALAALGWAGEGVLRAAIRRDTERSLVAVAALKAAQIETWIAARRASVATLARSPFFLAGVREALAPDTPEPARAATRAALAARLELLRQELGYVSAALLDGAGQVLADAGVPAPPPHWAALAAASGPPGVQLADLARMPERIGGEAIALGLVARPPLAQPAPVLAVRIDPHAFRYPLIQGWPVASATAETLLVRREGAQAVYLNELRHRAGTALRLRLPLADPALPAARALREYSGESGHRFRRQSGHRFRCRSGQRFRGKATGVSRETDAGVELLDWERLGCQTGGLFA